jgi:hypothetical protein
VVGAILSVLSRPNITVPVAEIIVAAGGNEFHKFTIRHQLAVQAETGKLHIMGLAFIVKMERITLVTNPV